jgi:hypothetical protein
LDFSSDRPEAVVVWDIMSRQITHLIHTESKVSAIAFSADGTKLAAAAHNGAIWLWTSTNSGWKELGHWRGPKSSAYASILFLANGNELWTGSATGAIHIWDVPTGTLKRALTAHADCVSSIAVSPDGQTLATGSWDRAIKLWHLPTGRELRSLRMHDSWIYALSFSPDGMTLASGGVDGWIRLIEAGPRLITAGENQSRSTFHFPDLQISNRFDLANWHPRHGAWEEGREVLEELLRAYPDDHWIYFQLAVLQLYLNDVPAYRRTAQAMLERFERGEQAEPDFGIDWRAPAAIMDRTAKVGLLLPPERSADVARLRDVMLRATGSTVDAEQLASWFAIGRGLAEYRTGNYQEAENLVRSLSLDGDPASERTLGAQLIFAMAAHRLGRVDDAARQLTEVSARLKANEQKMSAPNADRGTGWADWLICEILLREADRLIQGSTDPSD